jgi:hypothetical protein
MSAMAKGLENKKNPAGLSVKKNQSPPAETKDSREAVIVSLSI